MGMLLSRPPSRARRGQALLIAILVLFAVATLAALFTAIIGSQLVQVSRHSDVVRLRNLTESGLWLANEQLVYSMKGADWRPPAPEHRYRFGGGEVSVTVSYGPVPGRLQSRFMRIVSTARFPDNPFLRSTMVALKPVLLTDYALFITDRFETSRPARLGVSGVELAGQPRPDYLSYISGPVRSNTDLVSHGRTSLWLETSDDWVLRDDRIEIAGDLYPDPLHPADARAGDELALIIDGVTRAADLFSPQPGDEQLDYAWGFPDPASADLVPNGRVLANLLGYPSTGGWQLGPQLAVPRVRPPEIDATHPDTETNRYLLLTRDSGEWRTHPTSGAVYNTGEFGWAWTSFGGIYVDNFADIQYNHDLELLRRNWLASVGYHQTRSPRGDPRPDADATWQPEDGPPKGPADWWDQTGRYYSPPGLEIILHGEAACPYFEMIRHDDPDGDGVYWRDPGGNPTSGYVYSPPAGYCNPQGTALPAGIEGRRARFPFPPNGVIYVEGNARVSGIMPPARDIQARSLDDLLYMPYLDPDWTEGLGRSRRFDLQIVSGGTIYIEADLLSPRAAGLIDDDYDSDVYYGSRLALLARDCVSLNTTALNPRPVGMFWPIVSGGQTKHYNDLHRVYPPGVDPRYLLLRGQVMYDPEVNGPVATDPPDIVFQYHNLRLQSEFLRDALQNIRLLIGHSGWYTVDGAGGDPGVPPAASTDTDQAHVILAFSFRPEAGGLIEPLEWAFGSTTYRFVRPGEGDPASQDLSLHWHTEADHLELLPNTVQQLEIFDRLTGADLMYLTPQVMPVQLHNEDGIPIMYQIAPYELGYLLGPMAVAPPRDADSLPVEIHALIYAQNGSWFIIPGPWFNQDPAQIDYTQTYPGYREPLNIRISFHGALTENLPADLGAASNWTSKWSGPAGRGEEGFLSYAYDPLLRWARWDPGSKTGTPRFPNMPMTADLVIWGERITGRAEI